MDERTLNSELEAGNFNLPLKPLHREAMLDLVLAWGTLDGVLGMLLAKFLNLPLHEAADEIGKQNGSAKLAEVIKIISQVEAGKNFAKLLRKHKKTYEKYSKPRNKIAHGHCAGYLLCDENYVVFAVFERVAGSENMAADAVPVEEMERATKWGGMFAAWIMNLLSGLETRSNTPPKA